MAVLATTGINAQHSRISAKLCLPVLASMLALASCTGVGDDSSFAEQQELANIKTKNVVPLASGATLANTFQAFCLEGPPSVADRTARLRAAGFVPVGGWRGGTRSFVDDDQRPLVRLSDDGKLCGVTARARTGQDATLRARIAQWFPKAQPVETDSALKEIWSTGRTPDEGIGILRDARGRQENIISVALLRS